MAPKMCKMKFQNIDYGETETLQELMLGNIIYQTEKHVKRMVLITQFICGIITCRWPDHLTSNITMTETCMLLCIMKVVTPFNIHINGRLYDFNLALKVNCVCQSGNSCSGKGSGRCFSMCDISHLVWNLALYSRFSFTE